MFRKVGWRVMTVFAALVAAYAVALLWIPAMRPPFLRERFLTMPLAAYVHIGAASLALGIGPFQLNSRSRARLLVAHRWLGRAYVVAVILGGTSGLALATISQGGLPAHVGFGLLAVLWVAATATAYARIRSNDVAGHNRWMIRSYALTFAAVTLRLYLPLAVVFGVRYEPAYQAISWLYWVPNLVVAEWLILRDGADSPPRLVRISPSSADVPAAGVDAEAGTG
jgi:uncharacterized membrane protein